MAATILNFPYPLRLEVMNAYKEFQIANLKLAYQALYQFIASTHPVFSNHDELILYENTIKLINKCNQDIKDQEERVLAILKADALGEDISSFLKDDENDEDEDTKISSIFDITTHKEEGTDGNQ